MTGLAAFPAARPGQGSGMFDWRAETDGRKTFSVSFQKLIDDHLLKDDPEDFESCTFYMKMKGDYFRYVAEVKSGETKKSTCCFP